MEDQKNGSGISQRGGITKVIRHRLNSKGEHRQWLVKNYGTDEEEEKEIFKGDPEWEE